MELELSKSPRATWVWAPDDAQAIALRGLLEAAGHDVEAARGGNAEGRTLAFEVGAVAAEAMQFLLDAGYSFRWHSGEHPLNRAKHLYGIPVASA